MRTKEKGRGCYMYKNLEKLRSEKNISLSTLSDAIGVDYQTIYDKVHGKRDFSFKEAVVLKHHFFPEYEIEYLFKKDMDE